MKTNSTHFMKKIILSAMAVLALLCSVNVNAAFWGGMGNGFWRDSDSTSTLQITYAQLSGSIVYARILNDADPTFGFGSVSGICGEDRISRVGIRLFDVLPDNKFDECKTFIESKRMVSFTPVGKKWNENYYAFIAPKDAYETGAIVKIQMGNVETREPPKVLQVIKKNKDEWDDSCNANGEYNGVTCDGWSYKSIMHLWGTAYK